MLGSTAFPPIATAPYTMTLAPYGFFWFALVRDPRGAPRRSARARCRSCRRSSLPRARRLAFDAWARAVIDADVVPPALGAAEHGHVLDAFVAERARSVARVRRRRRRRATALRCCCASCGTSRCAKTRSRRARSGPARRLDRRTRRPTRRPRRSSSARCAPDRARPTTAACASRGKAMRDPRPRSRSGSDTAPARSAGSSTTRGSSRCTGRCRACRTARSRSCAICASAVSAQAPELLGTALVTDRSGETWVAVTSQTFVQNPTDVGGGAARDPARRHRRRTR